MRNYLLIVLLLSAGCKMQADKIPPKPISGNLKYARGFSIDYTDSLTVIEVYNPWNNYSLLARYNLSNSYLRSSDFATNIIVPVTDAAVLSSTYLGFISILNEHNKVVAASNANWIYDSVLYNNFRTGKIANLGNDLMVSAEAVIGTHPSAVIKYIYQAPDPVDPIIQKAGIPIIYAMEFMEDHPLGQAEWIKLFGALFNKKEYADSVFNQIEAEYFRLVDLAKKSNTSPEVLAGTIYKGTWYAVGGKSYVARLIADANASYYWSIDSSTGSLPLSFEVVIQKQKDADFWLNANTSSLNELFSIEPRCEIFKSFQQEEVYHYNKRQNENGGLDYYESGVARPDLVLRDLLIILHPGLIHGETTYYQKLEH
jgi:iron complex transport system substrate-binding protein